MSEEEPQEMTNAEALAASVRTRPAGETDGQPDGLSDLNTIAESVRTVPMARAHTPLWMHLRAKDPYAPRVIVTYALVSTTLGILCGRLLFPNYAGLVGVVLVSFSQAGLVEGLLNRNRDEIWGGGVAPAVANRRLASSLLLLFVGVFLTYLFAVQFVPYWNLKAWFASQLGNFYGHHLTDIDFGTFPQLLMANTVVLAGCFAFALIYRHGGMLLVLAWNASRWGVIFSYIGRSASHYDEANALSYMGRTLVCILPHLLLEAAAYVLVAMSGVFLSKAVAKYNLDSPEFMQVGAAVLRIAGFAFGILLVAVAVEAWLAPALVEMLFVSSDASLDIDVP